MTQNATYAATWKTDANGNGKADEDEEKYTVTYTDGVDGEEVFADQAYGNLLSAPIPPLLEELPPVRAIGLAVGILRFPRP